MFKFIDESDTDLLMQSVYKFKGTHDQFLCLFLEIISEIYSFEIKIVMWSEFLVSSNALSNVD